MIEDNETGDAGLEGDLAASDAEGARGASIFDLFEPPPEPDDSRFVPIVDPDAGPPGDDADATGPLDDSFQDGSFDDDTFAGADPEGVPAGDAGFRRGGAEEPAFEEPAFEGGVSDDTAHDAAAFEDGDDTALDDTAFDDTAADDTASDDTAFDDDDDFEDERADLAAIYELLPEAERPRTAEAGNGPSTSDLPAWTDPPTGQVPSVVGGDVWAETSGPTWKGEGPDDGSMDDLSKVLGDDAGELTAGIARRVSIDDDAAGAMPGAAGAPQRVKAPGAPAVEVEDLGGRNVPQAILVGLIVAGVALVAFRLGNVPTLALIAALSAAGITELFAAMRRVGLAPANLLGLTAGIAYPLAVYHRGEEGFLLVTGLSVVFGALWYVVGADTRRPALNLGLTLLGTSWVAGLAAFGALFLLADDGPSFLLAAVIPAVAFDTLAYAGGRSIGRTPFHSASPNKTWEGTVVGFIGAVLGAFVVYLLEISAFADTWSSALYLGMVVGVLCPLGDLTESLIKRDLGVKDMGSLLPGHGGVLDRIDGLLFVLPGAYYLARVLDLVS